MTHALAKACLGSIFFGGVLWVGTAASAAPQTSPFGHGGNGGGNGRHNHNVFVINSPSNSHDIQHVRDVNTGGNTITPAAVCIRPARHCRIIQNVWVDYP